MRFKSKNTLGGASAEPKWASLLTLARQSRFKLNFPENMNILRHPIYDINHINEVTVLVGKIKMSPYLRMSGRVIMQFCLYSLFCSYNPHKIAAELSILF